MTLGQMLVVTGAFIVAGIAKGAIGMGLPPIALALMTFAVPLEDALALMVVPSMATNIWQAIYGRGFVRLLRRFWAMAVASVASLMFVAAVRQARFADGHGVGRRHPRHLCRAGADGVAAGGVARNRALGQPVDRSGKRRGGRSHWRRG